MPCLSEVYADASTTSSRKVDETMNIQHSSRSDRWFTPPHIIQLCKHVLGEIEFDPASEPDANQIVQAASYFDEADDGLIKEWPVGCTVFLNPPGSKRANKSIAALFWARLMDYRRAGSLKHAIYMGFSLEQLAVSQKYHDDSMLLFPMCVPSERIKFVSPDARKTAPSHSNVIVYVPGSIDRSGQFRVTFSSLGVTR